MMMIGGGTILDGGLITLLNLNHISDHHPAIGIFVIGLIGGLYGFRIMMSDIGLLNRKGGKNA